MEITWNTSQNIVHNIYKLFQFVESIILYNL